MKLKQWIGMGLLAIITVTSIPQTGIMSKTVEAATQGKQEFVITDGVLSEYNGTSKNVVLPEGITRISKNVFEDSDITTITLPSTLEEIGDSAFAFCNQLKKITIPSNVTCIGGYAFWNCNKLEEIEFRNGEFSYIGYDAFVGTKWLTKKQKEAPIVFVNGWIIDGRTCTGSVAVSESAITITDNDKQKVITVSGTAIGMAEGAFYQSDIEEFILETQMKKIPDNAFLYCSDLVNARLPKTLTEIGAGAFVGCDMKEIRIPDSVIEIGEKAFKDCSYLKKIILPKQLESISNGLFYNARALEEIVMPENITKVGENAFSDTKWLQEQEKKGLVVLGSVLVSGGNVSKKVVIPENINMLCPRAFIGNGNITEIVIPEGIEQIGESAFEGCSALRKVTYPSTLTYIGDSAFEGTGIQEFSIESTEFTMGKWAFRDSAVEKVTIEADIWNIQCGAFENCSELTKVSIQAKTKEGENVLDAIVFGNCSSLEEVTIKGNLRKIGEGAFQYDVNLKKVNLPNTVKEIQENAFEDCEKLVKLEVVLSGLKFTYSSFDKSGWNIKNHMRVIDKKLANYISDEFQEVMKINGNVTRIVSYALCSDSYKKEANTRMLWITAPVSSIGKQYLKNLQVMVIPDTVKSMDIAVGAKRKKNVVIYGVEGSYAQTYAKQAGYTFKKMSQLRRITYVLNGGKNSKENPLTFETKKVTLKNPTRSGYSFQGWYTDKKCRHKAKSLIKNSKKEQKVYAKWKKK